MAINFNSINPGFRPNAEPANDPSEQPVSTKAPSSTGDTFNMTERAKQLRQLEVRIAELPVMDTQKIETLRQAIADGTYQVDATRIANKLIQLESESLPKE